MNSDATKLHHIRANLKWFREHGLDVCDPPFCFRCGARRAWCRCDEGPLSRDEAERLAANASA